jgi:hypothetical protein
MRRKIRVLLFCGGLAGSLVLGCEDHLTPSDVAGTYTLQTVDGFQLPIIILATTECDVTVVGGTLTLTRAGSHDILIDTPADCSRGGGGVTMASRTYPGTYELSGGRTISFRSAVLNGPDLVYTGVVAGDRITVTIPDLGIDPPDLRVEFAR